MIGKKCLEALLVIMLVGLAAAQAWAVPTNYSFSDTFTNDNDVYLASFTATGASTVTFRSYSYAGGTQADGTVVPAGGFDPIVTLFDASGNWISEQNDDPNDNSLCDGNSHGGNCYDVLFHETLASGSYTVAITQSENLANLPNLIDGFLYDGAGNSTFTSSFGCSNGQFCDYRYDPITDTVISNNRTGDWAFDILNVETGSPTPVPEPSTMMLLGSGLAGIIGFGRRRLRRKP